MKISTIMINLIIFSGLVTGISLFYLNLGQQYGVTNMKNITTLSRANEANILIQNTQANITANQGLLEKIYHSVGFVWGALINIVNIPAIFVGLVTDTVNVFSIPIPIWFITMVVGIFFAIFVFKILSAFTNRDM